MERGQSFRTFAARHRSRAMIAALVNPEKTMSSIVKAKLIFIAACLAVAPAFGQQPGRGKPAAKTGGAEKKAEAQDPLKQAAALFEAGQAAHQRGELEQALAYYNDALKHDPALWQAEFQASTAYYALKRFAEARQAILHVIQQLKEFADSPESRQLGARAQIVLGESALAEAKLDEAEQAFRRALELQPSAARAHASLAEVLLAAGKRAEAINEAKAALAAGDERVATLALLGEALTLAERYDESLPVLDEVLKREPQNAVALRYRAEVFARRNDLNGARRDLQAALAVEPRLQDKLRLAELHARAKQYNEAITLYQQVLKDEPTNKEAQTALAALLIESGQGKEAVGQLETLIQTQPNRADVRAQLAELYLPTQPEKALEQYSAAAKLEPENAAHQIGMGTALIKLRRFQEAVPLLRRVLAANPKVELVYFAHTNLATALFELDDFANAAREFVWILNQQREQKRAAITLYFLGICFDKLGDLEQAQKVYDQFLALASADNQLEIDKVKLRLPSLKRQLEKGQGKRKKQ